MDDTSGFVSWEFMAGTISRPAMVCAMLLVYGCGGQAHFQAADSKPASRTGDSSMGEDGPHARVLLADPDPPGIIVGGEGKQAEIVEVVGSIDEQRRSVESIQVLAWATKADTGFVPPRLYEEVLVLVTWKDSAESSLYYLWRAVHKSFREAGGWELGLTDFSDQMRESQAFDKVPSEAQIVDFTRATNFGNNEFLREYIVGPIVLYEHGYTKVLDLLQSGIPAEERKARRQSYENTLLEPLDDPIP